MDNFYIGYSNIALIKYWGKSNSMPIRCLTPSISLKTPNLFTKTKIEKSDKMEFFINNILQDEIELNKMINFISSFVKLEHNIKITSFNNMPTSAGLSSSSSGFMALTLATNGYFNLNKTKNELIEMCKYGSGSASRSFYDICEWNTDNSTNEIKSNIEFSMFAIIIDDSKKSISSRNGMKICQETSTTFSNWVEECKKDFIEMKDALKNDDFTKIGEIAEKNAIAMHNTCNNAMPAFSYLNSESYKMIDLVKNIRKNNIECYFTADAGANIKVFCKKNDSKLLEEKLLSLCSKRIIKCI